MTGKRSVFPRAGHPGSAHLQAASYLHMRETAANWLRKFRRIVCVEMWDRNGGMWGTEMPQGFRPLSHRRSRYREGAHASSSTGQGEDSVDHSKNNRPNPEAHRPWFAVCNFHWISLTINCKPWLLAIVESRRLH